MSGDISRLGKRDIANISAVENNMLFKPAKGRRSGVASALLCFTCGLCVILSLLCSLLATAVVVLGQKVEAFESRRSTTILDLYKSSNYYYNMTAKEPPNDLTFRLPKEVKPMHYDVLLHPDLVNGTYTGKVTILLDVREERSYIALHEKDLDIVSTSLRTFDLEENEDVAIKETYSVDKLEVLIVYTHKSIRPGLYNLTISFKGALRPDKIVGFYSSSYRDAHQRTRYIATSKFEPTYARRAFPCFDEPAFKAEFSVKLVHPSGDGYNALSNLNIENIELDKPSERLTTVTFAKSVPMSTYLAAFIVSDFVSVTATAKGLQGRTFPVSVFTTSAQKEKGAFALEVGVSSIEYYINLFNIDYPLPKLDMAAIPDFVSGAMENWGLITYRETALLYDQNISSTPNKRRVLEVVCHEFAHSWFGNLVTMNWWNDLWLNEGFATYMAAKCGDHIFPEWGLLEGFITSTIHPVMVTDAKLSSHPIVQTVSNPDEITAIFDSISYNKGASVLRMLENFMGADLFYAGVSHYLNKYAFSNAETWQFLEILQQSSRSKVNIPEIMDTWTKQMGYPVINVINEGTTYILTQKRFLIDPEAKYDETTSPYKYRWTIPVTYITSRNDNPVLVWFHKDADNLVITLDKPVEWIKLNSDQYGYYRVNYTKTAWESHAELLKYYHKRLSVADRANLLDDAFSLAEASALDYSIAMNMTTYLAKELHNVPWEVAASKLSNIESLLSTTHISDQYKSYVRNLVDSIYHEVNWEVSTQDDFVTANLRITILNLACSVGHVECLEEAGRLFNKWINDPKDNRPHPDIRSIVYYYGLQHVGGETEWNLLFKKFASETNASEKLKLMRGLSGVRSVSVLKSFLAMCMDEQYIRSQDTFTCLQLISGNPIGTPLVWDWVRENWEALVKRYTLNDRYLGRLIPAITGTFSTEAKLEEIKVFFAKYPEAGAGATARAQALENVANNIKWAKQNVEKLEDWLKTVKKMQ